MWAWWRINSPRSMRAKASAIWALPARSDLTSEPTRAMPHSSLASMKYSCSARRLVIRGALAAELAFLPLDIAGDLIRPRRSRPTFNGPDRDAYGDWTFTSGPNEDTR